MIRSVAISLPWPSASAQTDTTVLLTGESGVGKEVVARYIHQHSARRKGPFVAINCAAIPDSLLEATLFGYEKGAFSGAQQAQAGKFEQAQHGTLLLDEVTEMPLGSAGQAAARSPGARSRAGGRQETGRLDIRIVATSNRDMADSVAKGCSARTCSIGSTSFPLLIPACGSAAEDIVPWRAIFWPNTAVAPAVRPAPVPPRRLPCSACLARQRA
jgi:two-component system response regulator FlrC